MSQQVALPVLVRAFPGRRGLTKAQPPKRQWPRYALIFDTETTTDPSQRLLFGSFQLGKWDGTRLVKVQEGLFHADDLPRRDPDGHSVLSMYADDHALPLFTRREFVRDRMLRAIQAKAMIVAFNLPFDLSRLAVSQGAGRSLNDGAFSFVLWEYRREGLREWEEDSWRPRVIIEHMSSKSAFVNLGTPRPEASRHQGRFLDPRTLAYALTSDSLSLLKACERFEVEEGKGAAPGHGVITPEYIDYNRRDVTATRALTERLREEFNQYGIDLDPCKAYSPASIAKACYKKMGIGFPMQRFASVPDEFHGWAMSAYFGGRAEARIRRSKVPIVYTDFLSMYPTVNALLDLWRYVVADSVDVVDVTEEVCELIKSLELGDCFDQERWKDFAFLAQIQPQDDILPVRARYDQQNTNIGLNLLECDQPMWFTGPDIIASKLLTGRTPKILRAVALRANGIAKGLRRIDLGFGVSIDPAKEDFFRRVIELRKSLSQLDEATRERLQKALKIIANSGSYGVFAEMQPMPREDEDPFTVYGLKPFISESAKTESPGKFTFPFLAALTTGAARLMLAMGERLVTDRGGMYAFCDTDSMAIVSTRDGGVIDIEGEEVRALSWAEVDEIRAAFSKLKPYDPRKVREPILELEDHNFEDKARNSRIQLYAWTISAKRYVLFSESPTGTRSIVKPSEHGLGHLLNPTDPNSEDPDWMEQVWEFVLDQELDNGRRKFEWFDLPAMSRIAASSPNMLKPFDRINEGNEYVDQIKPFNFVLSAHVLEFEHKTSFDPERFHLIAPFESDPTKWLELTWIDRYSGQSVPVTTRNHADSRFARLKTYGEVVELYRSHPEPKSAGPDGERCGRGTAGILRRRRVRATGIEHIGKESHRLEEVEKGLIHNPNEVAISYGSNEWNEETREELKMYTAHDVAEAVGVSPRWVKAIRNGEGNPSESLKMALLRFLRAKKNQAA